MSTTAAGVYGDRHGEHGREAAAAAPTGDPRFLDAATAALPPPTNHDGQHESETKATSRENGTSTTARKQTIYTIDCGRAAMSIPTTTDTASRYSAGAQHAPKRVTR